MFLHLSVILSTGGIWQTPPPADTPLADTPLGRHPQGRYPLGSRHPSPRGQTPHPGQTLPRQAPPQSGRHPLSQAGTPSVRQAPPQSGPPPERWPLQRTIRILQECILVLSAFPSIPYSFFFVCNISPIGIFHFFSLFLEITSNRFDFLWENFVITEIHSDLDKLEKPKMFILVSSVMTWARSKSLDPVSVFFFLYFYTNSHI